MLNLDNIVSNKKKSFSEHNDWPFRMLIIGPSGSGKANALLQSFILLIKYIYTRKIPMKKISIFNK